MVSELQLTGRGAAAARTAAEASRKELGPLGAPRSRGSIRFAIPPLAVAEDLLLSETYKLPLGGLRLPGLAGPSVPSPAPALTLSFARAPKFAGSSLPARRGPAGRRGWGRGAREPQSRSVVGHVYFIKWTLGASRLAAVNGMCSDISDLSGGMREGSPGETGTRGSSWRQC